MPHDPVWKWRSSELHLVRGLRNSPPIAEYRTAQPESVDQEKFFASSSAAILASNSSKINSEPFRLVVKLSPLNTQNFGRFLLVATRFPQDLNDVLPFHRIQ